MQCSDLDFRLRFKSQQYSPLDVGSKKTSADLLDIFFFRVSLMAVDVLTKRTGDFSLVHRLISLMSAIQMFIVTTESNIQPEIK